MAPAVTKTWTTSVDFATWYLSNVSATIVADQVQLAGLTSVFPYLWIPSKNVGFGVADLVHLIDTVQRKVLGVYRAGPSGNETPSRTAVDQFGNCWVANQLNGTLTRYGLTIGGTRCNADGSNNVNGLYLKPPFIYNTRVDRDADGLLFTSRNSTDLRAWPAETPSGITTTAADEAVYIFSRPTGAATPSMTHASVDKNGDCWIGFYPGDSAAHPFYRVDHVTGLATHVFDTTVGGGNTIGGYGGVIDGQNVLWSASFNSTSILRYDIAGSAQSAVAIGTRSSHVVEDNQGNLWFTGYGTNLLVEVSPAGAVLNTFTIAGLGNVSGAAWRFATNTLFVVNEAGRMLEVSSSGALLHNYSIGGLPRGLAFATPSEIWTGIDDGQLLGILNAATGGITGVLTLDQADAAPRPHSTMNAEVILRATNAQGFADVVYDFGASYEFGRISWTETVPAGTSLIVQYRAAAQAIQLPALPWLTAVNAAPFTGVFGQFLEIRALFTAPPNSGFTPVLFDITAESVSSTGGGGGGQPIFGQPVLVGPHRGFSVNECIPNILLIAVENLGVEQVREFGMDPGSTYAKLPFLEKLTELGIKFTNAYAQPFASSSKSCYMTGRHPLHTGIGQAVEPGNQPLLDTETCVAGTLPGLEPLFLSSAAFGKWHLHHGEFGELKKVVTQGGFHSFIGHAGDFGPAYSSHDCWTRSDVRSRNGVVTEERATSFEYTLSSQIDDMIAYFQTVEALFFVYAPISYLSSPIHRPPAALYDTATYNLPHEFPIVGEDPRPYYKAMQQALDHELERFWNSLEQSIRANTLLFFVPASATQGALLPPGFNAARGSGTCYEFGTMIPMIVAGQFIDLPGRTSTQLVSPLDHYKTFQSMTGNPILPADPAESIRYDQVIRSRAGNGARTEVYLEQFLPHGPNLNAQAPGQRSIRNSQYKLLRNATGTSFPDAGDEFYDLLADPFELVNLIPGGGTGGLTGPQLSAYNSLRAKYITTVNTP